MIGCKPRQAMGGAFPLLVASGVNEAELRAALGQTEGELKKREKWGVVVALRGEVIKLNGYK